MKLTKTKVEELFESSKSIIYDRAEVLELPYSEDFETFHTKSVSIFKGRDEVFCNIRSRGTLTVEYGTSEVGIEIQNDDPTKPTKFISRYFIVVTGNHKGLRVVTMFSVDELD